MMRAGAQCRLLFWAAISADFRLVSVAIALTHDTKSLRNSRIIREIYLHILKKFGKLLTIFM